MGKKKNTPASAGVTSKEVVDTAVIETQEVLNETAIEETTAVENTEVVAAEVVNETATEENTEVENTEEVVNETEVIASDIFIAEDGTEVEFAVKHFIYARRNYTVAEAVAEIPEALQELYERKSFIFKKV